MPPVCSPLYQPGCWQEAEFPSDGSTTDAPGKGPLKMRGQGQGSLRGAEVPRGQDLEEAVTPWPRRDKRPSESWSCGGEVGRREQ